ncbi:MAG TPA: tripartite tricarboxylate transporter substrate-binding protein [Xanthobacteraceae bacterium]|jgi:tripartite-type tricarboxylate transporter receptor subunit TctC|nr:tripartite tricarboxylate transporter substrate-binding protein [Xanthobacteraceae bacterium]
MHRHIARWAATANIAVLLAAAVVGLPVRAQAPDWPTRPLTLVVPFAAGGSSDVIARIMADGISSKLRQPVVIENITGAGGLTGTSRVAKAVPDGYHFVIGNVGTFAQSQWVYKQPLYNALTEFAPVALLTDESLVLVARQDFPADNLQQFIAYLKANQAKLRFASSGVGGSNHLACMLFNTTVGVEVTHVPYRNVVQGMQDVMAGRVDYDCLSLPLALPQIAAKSVKPIAILSKNRSSILPELASANEQGLAGFDVPSWYALFVPAGTPSAIVQKLNRATVLALENQAVQERLKQIGGDVVAPERRSPEYLAQFLAAEIKKWEGPIKASGLSL